jgi:hypothetical protein
MGSPEVNGRLSAVLVEETAKLDAQIQAGCKAAKKQLSEAEIGSTQVECKAD